MTSATAPAPYLTELWDQLPKLRRIVLVGLPGTGKSLLVKELANTAVNAGRPTRILQWDISRRAWDREPVAQQKFPEIDGVTHAGIRTAMGMWVRSAIAQWNGEAGEGDGLLVVEAPLIGGRFSELASALEDNAEQSLTDATTLFVVIAPVGELRDRLRAQRAQDMDAAADGTPEQHNASADLLDELTDSLRGPAQELGIEARTDSGYDGELYAELMQTVLRHRRTLVIRPDSLMKVTGSVYELGEDIERVWPDAFAVQRSLREVEARSAADLAEHVRTWHQT
ncbi:ATP-binding protein [Rhodococcus sp. 14-2470-1a]|uniref:ATP-binding protein n=1 Tax=Rhodococcus sp. 14-2470-1a TaxID=2023150 RepID=UPI00117A68CD|nr:ATP-binding protein [Rhodococcus sp. 14-2470-1a]